MRPWPAAKAVTGAPGALLPSETLVHGWRPGTGVVTSTEKPPGIASVTLTVMPGPAAKAMPGVSALAVRSTNGILSFLVRSNGSVVCTW